jgi:3-oxoacyl-[acyl-carrier protein] reductase
VFLTRAFIDGMIARRFGRIVNITSIAVKQPLPMLGLSTSARLALTGFVAAIAREVAQHNVTVNNLLPGYFDTARLRKTLETWASQNQLAPSDAARVRQSTVPAQRFGEPGEFGQVCAFLCSKHASYVTGQNILLDGGLYSGTF